MKRKLPVIACLLFLSFRGISQNSAPSEKINYKGLYHTLSDSLNPFRFYLRFYEDGTVIGYTTAGNPKNLVPWFSKEHKSPSKGKYTLKADSLLHFSLKSEEGLVLYEGVIRNGNTLVMEVKSLINKYEGREEYFFWPVENLK